MKITKVLNYFWFLPFISFIFGYYILSYFFPKDVFIVPNITGRCLQDSIRVLTDKNLSLYFLKELEDPDLPEGIILSQTPAAGQRVKKNQNIFVTVSKKPKALITPDFLDLKQRQINKDVAKLGIVPTFYWVDSFYPVNSCIAQSPQPNKSLDEEKLIIYFSGGDSKFYIVPNLCGCKVVNIYDNLDADKIKLDVFYQNKKQDVKKFKKAHIVDQKPMAGSIIDLKKKLYLQVQVEK